MREEIRVVRIVPKSEASSAQSKRFAHAVAAELFRLCRTNYYHSGGI